MTVWLPEKLVRAIHEEQLSEHGGATGIRDPGSLESALARPLNRAGYGEPDTVELSPLYAISLAPNHPFIDGNKRVAYMALVTFLDLNHVTFEPPERDAVLSMLALADGRLIDEDFVAWVRSHATIS